MGVMIPGRRAVLAAIAALLLAAAPGSAAAPCHCTPETPRADFSRETPGGCHAAQAATPQAGSDALRHGETDSGPCQGSCGSCATVGGLAERRPDVAPTLVVALRAASLPAMRAGESRPPDHVPLPL
jgi:hypothetical protein